MWEAIMSIAFALENASSNAKDRFGLWSELVDTVPARSCAEVVVYAGAFAAHILQSCSSVTNYFMIDPWQNLDDWNKPANKTDDEFATIEEQAMTRTAFAASRRVVLRGRTAEVSHQVPDWRLDFCYIDGDHTLRGITIDLIQMWPKMMDGGVLGGDDFSRTDWQHPAEFEPTMVFPLAVYFAEAVGAPIYALPFNQFAIQVDYGRNDGFEFRDLSGTYDSVSVLDALERPSH
jgi:hypothetical protein